MKKHLYITLLACAVVSSANADGDGDESSLSKAIQTPRRRDVVPGQVASQKPKQLDLTEVRPHLAIKKTSPKEVNLPGVMKLQGEDALALDFTRARRISMNNGGAVVTYVSADEPNRIQLPFVNPRVISLNSIAVDRRAESNNIYITVKADWPKDKSIPVFIEHPSGRGPVLALQLLPKKIISQTLLVDDVAPELTEAQLKDQRSSDFITSTQATLEIAAQGGAPQGYSIVALQTPPIALNGLLIEVEKKLSSRENDIYIYRVTNPGSKTAVVKETEFDGDLVQAVSIHPTPTLKSGERTRVLVLARKERKER